MRATARLANVAFNTVVKLLIEAGQKATEIQNRMFVDLKCERIQLDEIWSFVGAKQGNCTKKMKRAGKGDAWTWIAIDADTKLIAASYVGERSTDAALAFLRSLKARLSKDRVQITSDGFAGYIWPMRTVFMDEADYGMLVKVYGDATKEEQRKYSPAPFVRSLKTVQAGQPNPKHISTSYVERQNLTLRMSNRRFTRLSNAFSKKLQNHAYSVALYTLHYNFCRIHQTVRCTPAMEAGVTDHIWTMAEVVAML